MAWGGNDRVGGVEREFTALGPDGVVDARRLWPALALGTALDPGDPLARRTTWGGLVTADGREAEAATPPVTLAPGCTRSVLDLAAAGRRQLADALAAHPPGHRLVGYSTHLSVEVPESRVCRVARLVADHLAVPLMLALDRVDSPGLLVRPRHGRLEVGGEFTAGTPLRTALVMAVAMVRLAEHATRHPRWRRRLPRPVVTVVPAVGRHGWYVDRRALGTDLYASGRATAVHLRDPASTATAGDLLARSWALARPGLTGVLASDEIALGDDLVAGRTPLPLEHPDDDDGTTRAVPVRDYGPRRVDAGVVAVEAASWHRAVVRVEGPSRTRWATLPGRALDAWLADLDAGHADRWVRRTVAGDAVGRRRQARHRIG